MPSGTGGNKRRTARSLLKRKIFDQLLAEFLSKKDAYLSLSHKEGVGEEDIDIVYKEVRKHLGQQGSSGIYSLRNEDEQKQ